ncbi:hypothetical protein [Candidatus Nitrosocosmicus franklandus]|uniref:Uncharacterized protein n=1 Tax=Candidatus Nitrosocosmicus franklandianus TaxID=1798806 RepID=A0A484I863_9ARCH|nr:hypothetical protein [Candidatus Nitrosocosmicus franklandus]VFJ13381.1 conserved protein of unknown function [Candidatus Nitrosocosmicus franklandus]
MSDNKDKGGDIMGCGCNTGINGTIGIQRSRGFLTREEKVELLKEYKNDLEKEARGVSEKIRVRGY